MKWFKPYSSILIVVSILLIILSLFMIDIVPLFYQFYMGEEFPLSKMDRLISFSAKVSQELRIFSIFLLISAIIMFFIKTVKQYFIVLAILLLAHFLIIAEITEFPILKRFYKMSIMLPLLWIFFDYFKFKKESYYNKITNSFLYITLLCIVLPGLYIPPFFGGIQGWTVEFDKRESFPIDGVYLVREDGEEIRYSRAIISPINFLNRIDSFMLRAHPEKIDALLEFYKNTYIKRYDLLKTGLIPSQKYLKSFAYPTHNPVGTYDYSQFPPKSIKEIKISRKYYNWDKSFVKEEILAHKEWR